MILKISIDTKASPEMFEDLGIPDQVVFAEVAAIAALKDSRKYALKTLLLACDEYVEDPRGVEVAVRKDHARLYAEYGDESIDIPVRVETMPDFPLLNWI